MIWKPTRSVNTTLTKWKSRQQPNELPNWRRGIMPNTTGRRSCTVWHILSDTACHQEPSLSAAGFQTVCIPVCKLRRYFMATSSRTPLIICPGIFLTSTTAARWLCMNWSTNCLNRGSRLTNHSIAFSLLHSKRQQEESRHLMSAPAQEVHLPICLGTIKTRIGFTNRNPKVADKTWKMV